MALKKREKTKSKMKKPSDKVKASRIAPLTGDEMTHAQTISQSRELTVAEVAECGGDLAREELNLDQVRKEKKEVVRGFDNQIKDHLTNIMKFSQAIDTGILTENIECEVVLNRENDTKTCYPKDGSDPFVIPMSPDDFELLV